MQQQLAGVGLQNSFPVKFNNKEMTGEVSWIFQDLVINLSHCVPARGPPIQDFNLCSFAMLESSDG